ncbi:MAG: superinfection exclusion B family protein, partial [Planctomycetes bacterium]|nr:superinfection exclusion B family protein [Planctomycetota bacterium]
MSEFWIKLIDWIKQPPRVVAAIAVACGIILFSPSEVQDVVYVTSILNTIGPYIGIVFVLACTLLITSLISFSYSWSQKQILRLKFKRLRVQSLSDLTPDEKKILRYYILRNTKTQKLPSVPIMGETTASWFITVEGKEVERWRKQGCWEQNRWRRAERKEGVA